MVIFIDIAKYKNNYLNPITSVDVEKSFFIYKNISGPQIQHVNEDNLFKYMVVIFFF